MKIIKNGWDFFQDQILGMHWLKDLIGKLLVDVYKRQCTWWKYLCREQKRRRSKVHVLVGGKAGKYRWQISIKF